MAIGLGLGLTLSSLCGLDGLAPAAPTIDLRTASDSGSSSSDNITSDTTPTFDVDMPSGYGGNRDVTVGDTLRLEISDDISFSTSVTDTIDAGDVAVDTLPLTPTALSDGVYYARARIERTGHNGPWSSVLTFTVDTTGATISTSATQSVAENAALSVALTANETATWTITGGVDSAQFEISGTTLRWVSNGSQNFEAPLDANADNDYVVQVTATDVAGNTSNKTITVTVTDVVEAGGADSILMETNDHLLLETADRILME